MAHILELVKPGKTFTAGEMVEEKINGLAQRMSDAKMLCGSDFAGNDSMGELIDAWRNELFAIRIGVRKMTEEPPKKPERPEPPKTASKQ